MDDLICTYDLVGFDPADIDGFDDRDRPTLADLAPDYQPDEDDEYVAEPSHLVEAYLIYVDTPDGYIPANAIDE